MSDRCFRHWMTYRIRQLGLVKGVLNQTNKNLREKLIVFLAARYQAVLNGKSKSMTYQDAYREAVALRIRLNLAWGGRRGAVKIAKLIQQVERRARINREDKDVA